MSEEGGTGTVGKRRAEESRRNSVDARGERERGNGYAGAGTRKEQAEAAATTSNDELRLLEVACYCLRFGWKAQQAGN
jgi:hypothetical protein